MHVKVGFPNFLDLDLQGWDIFFTSSLHPFKIKKFVLEKDMLGLKKMQQIFWVFPGK